MAGGEGTSRMGWRAALVLAALVSAGAMALHVLGALQPLEHWAYDQAFRWRPAREASAEVVLLAVTDDDVRRYGRWPWPRALQANVIEALAAHAPSAIACDIVYAEPSSDLAGDDSLAAAIRRAGNVVLAFGPALDGERVPDAEPSLVRSGDRFGADPGAHAWMRPPGLALPLPAARDACHRLGHVSPCIDPDGMVRRVPLMMAYGTRLYPSLALQAALVHSGAEFSQVRINPWELSLVGLPGNRRVRVPLDGTGCLWVLVPGPLESSFTGLSVSQLLNGQVPDLRGKAVVVGLAASGQTDMHPAPGVGQIPGIAVHASVLSGLLGGQVIQVLRWPWVALATVGLALSAVAAVRVCRPAIGALAGVALCAALAAAATAGFCRWDVWLNPVPAALAGGVSVLLALAVSYAASETRKRDIRRTLGRYLSPRILDELLRSAGSVAAVPRRKELTVFFSDIRSFTAIAERLEPEDLAELLRLYVERMADIAHRCDGTIDKFIGDGMMVFFGDPVAQPDHAERCVRMALAMQQAVAELNLELTRRGLPAIGVGMGINTGYATVGSLGSTRFASYTALGRTVNIAARLADLAEAGQILCGERTARLAGAPYACRPLGDMALRHVERPVPVYAVAVPEGTDGHAAAQGAAGG